MANQFTKAEELGTEKPKGSNQFTTGKREKMDDLTKAKIRAAYAADKLEDYLRGECELDSSKVAAAKALMDKGMPSLQAVEQTTYEEPKSEAEIKAQLHALLPVLLKDPGTRAQIQAMLTGTPTSVSDTNEAQQAAG